MYGASVVQRCVEMGVFCDWNHFVYPKIWMLLVGWLLLHNTDTCTHKHNFPLICLLVIICLTSPSFTVLIHLFYLTGTFAHKYCRSFTDLTVELLSSHTLSTLLFSPAARFMADNYMLPEHITAQKPSRNLPSDICLFTFSPASTF